MTHHRPRNPKDRGVRTGVFDVEGSALDQPCAAKLAEELRKIADPQVAAVWLAGDENEPDDISIANPGGLVRSHLELVRAWLAPVTVGQALEVPELWRKKLCAQAVLALPILSPVCQFGVAAFPVLSSFELVRREAEHRLSDFALRLERHQRQQRLLELRQSVSSEPRLPGGVRKIRPHLKNVANG